MHYFTKAEFIKSCNSMDSLPLNRLNEVVFVGKSNVGKSSLINSLVNQKRLAYTSSTPGMTRLLNYYLIEDRFYFVDFPGYGYSKKKDLDYIFYSKFVDAYFDNNKYLKLIIFLLDSRHKPTEDDALFYKFIKENNFNYLIVMTKCDKLNMSMKSKITKNINEVFKEKNTNYICTSINDLKSIESLKTKIEDAVR